MNRSIISGLNLSPRTRSWLKNGLKSPSSMPHTQGETMSGLMLAMKQVQSSSLFLRVSVESVKSLSHVWLFTTPWTVAHQAPVHSLGKNTGEGSHSLLRGIFPIQGSNPGLLHCRQILYQLSHLGSLVFLKLTSGNLQDPEHSENPARLLRHSEDYRHCLQVRGDHVAWTFQVSVHCKCSNPLACI